MAGYFKSLLGSENMITDIECRSEIGPDLDSSKLNSYWQQYFDFLRDAAELHALSEAALTSALNGVRAQSRPFLDAQRAISGILTRFGSQHNFHRQFNERFDSKPSQVLGMQLYEIVARDSDWWVYLPTQHAGHAFPHATYFMPRGDTKYVRLLQRHATC
jgi:hypothetical protein